MLNCWLDLGMRLGLGGATLTDIKDQSQRKPIKLFEVGVIIYFILFSSPTNLSTLSFIDYYSKLITLSVYLLLAIIIYIHLSILNDAADSGFV